MYYMDRELPPVPNQDAEANTKPAVRSESSLTVVEGDGLPPQDSGKGAYVFLIGACIIEGASWALPYSYGVFGAYFFSHSPFSGITSVSTTGVIANGSRQIILPFLIYFLRYYPRSRKTMMWFGMLICAVAVNAGAHARAPMQLVVCLGPMYGLGAGMLFAPVVSYMSEWFVKRKSIAYGILTGMDGLVSAALTPVFTFCLNKFGYTATLLGWAIAFVVLSTIGILCIRPRLPASEAQTAVPKARDFAFVRKPLLWVLLAATMVQALAQFVPSTYMPSYSLDVGLSPTLGSLLLSLLNLGEAIGQPLQGTLADSKNITYTPMVLSTIGACIETLLIWGYSRQVWSLIAFALLYGSTAGGFSTLRPRFAAAIANDEKDTEQNLLVFGVLTAMRGVAIVCSGFISSSILNENAKITSTFGVGKWSRLILYVGIMMLAASLGACGAFIRTHKATVDGIDEPADKLASETGAYTVTTRSPRCGVGLVISMYEEHRSEEMVETPKDITAKVPKLTTIKA